MEQKWTWKARLLFIFIASEILNYSTYLVQFLLQFKQLPIDIARQKGFVEIVNVLLEEEV